MLRKELYFYILASVAIWTASCSQRTQSEEKFFNPEFDSVYTVIATETSAANLELSLSRADSLMQTAENDFQVMKTWMLTATIHRRSGNLPEALAHATLASELGEKNKFYSWQVRIAGFLSTTYREAELMEEARQYLEKAEKANDRLKGTAGYHVTQLMIHQEKAYFIIEEDQDYNRAVEELNKANACYDKLPPDLSLMNLTKATTEQLLGLCYFHLGEYSLSEAHYYSSLNNIGEGFYGLEPFVWFGLGDIRMIEKDYGAAFEYYEKAKEAKKSSENFHAKSGLHKRLAGYYNEVGKDEEAFFHQKEYTALMEERRRVARNISGEVLQILKAEKENTVLLSRAFLIIIVILVLLIPGILLLKMNFKELNIKSLFFSMRKAKRDDSTNGMIEESTLAISHETEARILSAIEQMEEKEYYLDSNLSLPFLASQLNTNTKYVAYVINKYRKQDFSNYINGLRIENAMKEIRSNRENLDYKIAYLAGEFGFSSHASFTNAFKKNTGMSPSQFISQVRNETSYS